MSFFLFFFPEWYAEYDYNPYLVFFFLFFFFFLFRQHEARSREEIHNVVGFFRGRRGEGRGEGGEGVEIVGCQGRGTFRCTYVCLARAEDLFKDIIKIS